MKPHSNAVILYSRLYGIKILIFVEVKTLTS
ncbi:Uncharacterised protein [Porphyromonas macacae]|uniref:Uncharacterized protein n=1 Tax=Porphyromonas macacae TaxID=28115 RepID=A0A379DF33_9PORP|nr:Uncharacterised protein [Porphyromonas macacae]